MGGVGYSWRGVVKVPCTAYLGNDRYRHRSHQTYRGREHRCDLPATRLCGRRGGRQCHAGSGVIQHQIS